LTPEPVAVDEVLDHEQPRFAADVGRSLEVDPDLLAPKVVRVDAADRQVLGR